MRGKKRANFADKKTENALDKFTRKFKDLHTLSILWSGEESVEISLDHRWYVVGHDDLVWCLSSYFSRFRVFAYY